MKNWFSFDLLAGFLGAVAVFCFVPLVVEYRDLHCHSGQEGGHNAPTAENLKPVPEPEKSAHGNEEIGKHGEPKPALKISCGALGLPAAMVAFMDDHEGFFVGIFTFFLVVSTALLWRSTEKLWRAGEKQATTIQRAFVFLSTIEAHVINANVHIMPKWENSGSTAANPAKSYGNWKTFIGPPPANYDWPDLDQTANPLPRRTGGDAFHMGPRSTKYSQSCEVPIAFIEEVRARRQRLFVWGWIEYEDAFADTPSHRTEFCNEVIVTGMGKDDSGATTAALTFPTYGPYNTAT